MNKTKLLAALRAAGVPIRSVTSADESVDAAVWLTDDVTISLHTDGTASISHCVDPERIADAPEILFCHYPPRRRFAAIVADSHAALAADATRKFAAITAACDRAYPA